MTGDKAFKSWLLPRSSEIGLGHVIDHLHSVGLLPQAGHQKTKPNPTSSISEEKPACKFSKNISENVSKGVLRFSYFL